MKDGDIYDIGQTVNGVSRFLYLENKFVVGIGKWYYARSIVMRYNYDESELTKTVKLDEDDSVNDHNSVGNNYNEFKNIIG